MSERAFRLAIYVIGFVLGFVLMGFEMLSSRYLNPWFGSGIYTWAAIISVTLFALMAGYFLGGRLVDRFPTARLLGALVILSAICMAAIALPFPSEDDQIVSTADAMLLWVIDTFDVGPNGVTIAAFLLIFAPITLIACYSPFAVRLLLVSTESSGRQTGSVYGINTFGNILGTWFTSFYLVPWMGSLAITITFAVVTFLSGVALILLPKPEPGR
ncbi:MAG: fused MFS/spermidine synthase [Pseudomonadota bacterium]